MVARNDKFDGNPCSVPTADSSPIFFPGVSKIESDILRSRSQHTFPLPSVRMGSSYTIEPNLVKEVIDSLFFQLDHQQDIMNRYGDMDTALAR